MDLEETIAIAATISNLICYASPLAASIKFYRQKTTGNVASLPLVSTIVSSLFWLMYGLLVANSMLIRINGFGLVLFIGYVFIYYTYCPSPVRLFTELRYGLYLALVVFPLVMLLQMSDARSAALAMGLICNCLTISVYGAPLGTVGEVIKLKNTSSMSAPLILSNLFSSVVWMSYGVVIWDIFLMVPNSLGMLLCGVQCALLLIYPSSPVKKDL